MKARIAGLIGLLIGANFIFLPFSYSAQAAEKLLLAPGERLALSTPRIDDDTVCVTFVLEVPDSAMLQRHRCELRANQPYLLKTSPSYDWALKGQQLMVLSSLELTLCVPAEFADRFEMHFDFVNLDKPTRSKSTASLLLASAAATASSPQTKNELVVMPSGIQPNGSNELRGDFEDSLFSAHPAPEGATTNDSTQAAKLDSLQGGTLSHNEQKLKEISGQTAIQSNWMVWALIGFLIIGIALMMILNTISKMKTRGMVMTAKTVRKNGSASQVTASKTATEEDEVDDGRSSLEAPAAASRSSESQNDETASARPQSSPPVEKTTGEDTLRHEPNADKDEAQKLQNVLAKLEEVTAEARKALVSVSGEMGEGERVSGREGEWASGKTPSRPPLTHSPTHPLSHSQLINGKNNETEASHGRTNGPGASTGIRLELGASREAEGELTDITEAIDGVVAASAMKPIGMPNSEIDQKMASLRQTSEKLRQLANLCHERNLKSVEEKSDALGRRLRELLLTYETWSNDRSLKFSVAVAPPEKDTPSARREIVESLLDGLYETRKMAAQGAIYFERRATQMLEQDLPKLRRQFEGIEDDGVRRIWEEMEGVKV